MINSANPSGENVSMIVDKSWKGTYKVGGVCLILTGIFFAIGFILTIAQGGSPGTVEETLTNLARQTQLYQAANGAFILSDVFPIPAMLALYLALKGVKRTHALIATAMGLLGVTLAIVLRIGLHGMGTLASGYMAATNEAQRASYEVVAEFVTGATDSGLLLANLLIYGFTLTIGIAMLAGVFRKGIAYLAIVTGILGILGLVGGVLVPALTIVSLIAALGWLIWFFIAGFSLARLG